METVAVFTDTYLPTVNGVTYTVRTWRQHWERRGGRMPVVYPRDGGHPAGDREYPVPSVPFPFYRGFRFGWPSVPDGVAEADPDIVHVHTPFTLGLAGLRLARRLDVPLVASYHTPAREYATYISDALAGAIRRAADEYERWFFGQADAVITPSSVAADAVRTAGTPIHVVSNGVDIDRFASVDEVTCTAFRDRHGLPNGPLVGYTGRHGHEKRLQDLVAATADVDATVAIAGDGPARGDLERLARRRDEVHFLGFLDREELPAFYSTLDAFAFPSPVETQGLVALEATACGTPVVGVDRGALAETIVEGVTGYHFQPGDIDGFESAIRRTLAEASFLSSNCLDRRGTLSVERSIDDLEEVYASVAGLEDVREPVGD